MKILGILLMLLSGMVSAETTLDPTFNEPDWVKNNPIIKTMMTRRAPGQESYLEFPDGYQQKILPPYELRRDESVSFRCPCNQYFLTMTQSDGSRITRTILVKLGDDNIVYRGANGDSWDIDTVLNENKEDVTGLFDGSTHPEQTCEYKGDPNIVTNVADSNCNTGLCYGQVVCRASRNRAAIRKIEGDVSCLSVGPNCPSAKACLDDPAVEFSTPGRILENEVSNQRTGNSSGGATNE